MAGLFKAGLNSSKVSAKFEFSFESLKSKFSLIQLIGSSSMEKAIRENSFEQKKKKLAIYFSPGLALIDRPTTGSRTVINQASIFNWTFVTAHAYFQITLLFSCFVTEHERLSACRGCYHVPPLVLDVKHDRFVSLSLYRP